MGKVATAAGVLGECLGMADTRAAAGVKQQLQGDAQRVPGVRLLPGRFRAINRGMVMPRGNSAAAAALLESYIAQQKQSGFVAQALARHGIEGAAVAQ